MQIRGCHTRRTEKQLESRLDDRANSSEEEVNLSWPVREAIKIALSIRI